MSRKKRRVPRAPEPAAPSEAPRKVPRALVEIGDFNQPPLPSQPLAEEPPAAASSGREAVPPPSDWVWPREGERIEVEVLRDGDRIARWITATVASVLADGWFSALIRVTSGAQHDEWTDWFTWLEEGKDWRRAGRALEKGWDAATVQRKLTALREAAKPAPRPLMPASRPGSRPDRPPPPTDAELANLPAGLCKRYQQGRCHKGRSCKWKHELWPELQARWEKFRKSGEAAAAAAAAARRPRLSSAKPAVSVLPPPSFSRCIPRRPASDAPKPRRSDPRRDKPRAKKGRAGPHPAASSASASAAAAALPAATTLHLPDTRAFWAAAAERVPAAARYDARRVEAAARGLEGSLLVAPHDRVEWFLALGELMAVGDEATRRHADALALLPRPAPMPVAYIAQRIDTDDPLWGWQVRHAASGQLQGFVTLTRFTTWSADFAWDSASRESGMPSARLSNARLRSGEPYGVDPLSHITSGEGLAEVARARGVDVAELVNLNKDLYPGINSRSKLLDGTRIQLADPAVADLDADCSRKDTPRTVAARTRLPLDDLLAINAARFSGGLEADTPLDGKPLLLRDRESEVDLPIRGVERAGGAEPPPPLPKGKKKAGKAGKGRGEAAEPAGLRQLDEDCSLTALLAQQERRGDPTKDGVQWTRIAEVGLLASLGGGGTLVRYALQRLKAEGHYHFAVCQATLAAVGFYERIGFRRVGARARYAENREGEWTGYRHWAEADERTVAEFGDTSYLMALDLREWSAGPALELPVADEYPAVAADAKAPDLRRMSYEGGTLAYESGDGVVVSLVPVADGPPGSEPELRMDVTYEIESILSHRGTGRKLEYLVRWVKWPNPTWEPWTHLVGSDDALRDYAARSGTVVTWQRSHHKQKE